MSSTRVVSMLQRASSWTADGISLAQSLHQAWRIHPKPVTLLLADHQDNQVARSLLRWHQEYNLVRYYGFRGYLEQRRQKSAFSMGAPDPATNSTAPPPPPAAPATSTYTMARISFMVTARMKEELAGLGYSTESVAKLTPLQASLILQSQLRDATPAQLEELVQQHEEQVARDHEARMAQLAKDEELRAAVAAAAAEESERVRERAAATTADPSMAGSGSAPQGGVAAPQPSLRSSLFTAFASRNELQTGRSSSSPLSPTIASATSGTPRVWFELVERHQQPQPQESVVGLYSSQGEAQESLETHQFFAQRNGRDGVEFEIRQTTR